jgi:hypothetical protein
MLFWHIIISRSLCCKLVVFDCDLLPFKEGSGRVFSMSASDSASKSVSESGKVILKVCCFLFGPLLRFEGLGFRDIERAGPHQGLIHA